MALPKTGGHNMEIKYLINKNQRKAMAEKIAEAFAGTCKKLRCTKCTTEQKI